MESLLFFPEVEKLVSCPVFVDTSRTFYETDPSILGLRMIGSINTLTVLTLLAYKN
jgi:hypothetical protein